MADWTDVAATDDVPEDDVIGVQAAGKDLALYSVEGAFYATDNICTHGHARLCDGFLEGRDRMPAAPGPVRRAQRQGHVRAVDRRHQDLPLKVEEGVSGCN